MTLVYCGQTAGWMKMPLGTEVGLGTGDIVLERDPAPLPRKGGRAQQPPFSAHVLWRWPNGWMDEDDTWYGGRPWPRRHCVRWGPSPPPQKKGGGNFRPVSVVAKRLDGSCMLVFMTVVDILNTPCDCKIVFAIAYLMNFVSRQA